ncbi:signal peptidase I [Halalkalibacter krulwichiae]|uniref:Signal peptidase I n=1 Tax=Halalkalibacter krulwichiae TaxID=199441 RepID=A0A1X9MAY3_9BACI|nr:signal peptidase I [Halalkalibacter krulwichiae]ARK30586.1 Signal peptidase I T [Halalkalibacter krulwichiae]
MRSRTISYLKWGNILVLALVFAISINIFLVQPYIVSGSSMEPTLAGEDFLETDKVGDRILVFKSAYILGNVPEYGEMVIIDSRVDHTRTIKDQLLDSPILSFFSNSRNKGNIWIKRVIGEAGDTIEFKDGSIYRNGDILMEDYIKEEMLVENEKFVIPKEHVFVMGDNRNNSSDSREIGPVPIENVVGKVILRFYPFERIGIL